MSHKILITGANGMLGTALKDVFADYDVMLTDSEELDITNAEAVHDLISEIRPNYIINAAAYTNVDGAESDANVAMMVNGEGVGNVSSAACANHAILVHISTDYVFDGNNEKGYTEDAQEFGPLNVYGESKLLGEKLLQENCDTYYLVRTSWLYGPGGKNFVTTMLSLGEERDEIQVVNDQIGRPTYTYDLAEAIKMLIEDEYGYGIYHCTNDVTQGGISWYEFALEIFGQSKTSCEVVPVSSEAFPRPAKRPHNSIVLNTKLPKQRDWKEALTVYLDTLNNQ
jgi:dTDP-4-dehydrorhamnose reductase